MLNTALAAACASACACDIVVACPQAITSAAAACVTIASSS